jgi:hypothetical protein
MATISVPTAPRALRQTAAAQTIKTGWVAARRRHSFRVRERESMTLESYANVLNRDAASGMVSNNWSGQRRRRRRGMVVGTLTTRGG